MLLASYQNTTLLDGMPYHSHIAPFIDDSKGFFTYQPEFDSQGTILSQAADATNRTTGEAASHSKLDRTNYVYLQRSYGVGAPVGLTDDGFLDSTLSYKYIESGFLASTACIYNDSSQFYIGPNIAPGSWTSMQVFEAGGSLPIGGGIGFVTANFGANGVVAIQATTVDNTHMLGIATGATGSDYYSPLYNVQCNMTFSATNFSVSVDRSLRTINVEPLNSTIQWPAYGSTSVNGSVGAIFKMSSSLCTTMYTQILGQTLMYNIYNAHAVHNTTISSETTTITLQGIANAVTSWLDNFLQSYAAAQIMKANQTQPIDVETSIRAVTIGTPAYIFPIFTVNLVICTIYVIEMVRTRAWQLAPRFSFLDVKSVVVGASVGGTDIARHVRSLHDVRGSVWHADQDDRIAGETRVRLASGSLGNLAVVLVPDTLVPGPIRAPSRSWLSGWKPWRGGQSLESVRYQQQADLQHPHHDDPKQQIRPSIRRKPLSGDNVLLLHDMGGGEQQYELARSSATEIDPEYGEIRYSAPFSNTILDG